MNVLRSTEKAESAIFYSYQRYINGFAATLDEKQASEIASKEYSFIRFSLTFLLPIDVSILPCFSSFMSLWQSDSQGQI